MHRGLTRRGARRGAGGRADQRGAVALMVGLFMTLLVMCAAFTLDFGLLRSDRQVDQSAADAAVVAGLHGLNLGDGSPHPYAGVCTAVHYLQVGSPRFAGISPSSGWSSGAGGNPGDGCTSSALRAATCAPGNQATWARWRGSGSSSGVTYDITVQSGYSLATSGWPDDALAASTPDTSQRGCDQLAVTITQRRPSLFGSLITSSPLATSIRSVGRLRAVPGHTAPAMLLLRRTGCPALQTGNSGGGSGTFIHVLGAIGSGGLTQPGTIHSDSDGTGCSGGSNSNVFTGAQPDGIVAYAAPLAGSPGTPDPARPGVISSVAAAKGASPGVVRDSLAYVHGSSALAAGGTSSEVTGRQLVTRSLIDDRYFLAVKAAIGSAGAVFGGSRGGWSTLSGCNPTQAALDAFGPSTSLAISCNAAGGFASSSSNLTIKAGNVYFSGTVAPSGTLSLPNAQHVYVDNTGSKADAVLLGNGATLGVDNGAANLTGGTCSNGQSSSHAVVLVRDGDLKESNGGLLQLCHTTLFLLGGQSDGCVPGPSGTAPTSTPCGGSVGTGQLVQQGGNVDWTAPDAVDAAYDAQGNALPAATAAWRNPDGPEDLALWTESATSSSVNDKMAGGGTFHVRGVFMLPNADPFTMSGGAGMNLTNAQYVVSSIQLNGGTQITMSVDPNSAVVLPDIGVDGLVR